MIAGQPGLLSAPRFAMVARILLPIYLIIVACIVFSPADQAPHSTGFVAWVVSQIHALRDAFPTVYIAVEFIANIAMFVPFGVLVPLAFPSCAWWLTALLGFATTITIELAQRALPSRYSTVSDVLANTFGTLAGLALLWALRRRR